MVTKADLAAFEERLHLRFAAVEERFAGTDENFDRIEERFAGIDERFAGIDERFAGVERAVGETKHSIDVLKEQAQWRFEGLAEQGHGGQQEVLATMRSEMMAQTRTMVFAVVGPC